MAERFVLWDVDGTLVQAGSVGTNAYDRAVERVLGRRLDSARVVPMSGKTDPQIALEILAAAGLSPEEVDGHLALVLALLEEEIAKVAHLICERGQVLPGVPEVLARLHAADDVLQSVLTGNTTANAMVKLGAFGLERWLDLEVGAYGSDHADRRNLVPIALERARLRRGLTFAPHHVWVIGDTPLDLACARAANVRCLLVGTGKFSCDELHEAGPDILLADLSDVDAVVELLRSLPPPSPPAGGGRPAG